MSALVIVNVSSADHRAMRELEWIFDKWLRQCRRTEAADESKISSGITRYEKLAEEFKSILESDRLTQAGLQNFMKRIEAEKLFLKHALEKERERRISRRREAKQSQRFWSQAHGLLKRYGQNFSPDLSTRLKAVEESALSREEAKAAILEALSLVDEPPAQMALDLSPKQLRLLAKLKDDEAGTGIQKWQAAEDDDPRWARLETRLTELEIYHPQALSEFTDRLAELKTRAGASDYSLLLDSLILDVAETAARQRRLEDDMDKLQVLMTDIRERKIPAPAELAKLSPKSLAELDPEKLSGLLLETQCLVEEFDKQEMADLNRRRILNGLAELGYEVNENMATLWQDKGRLILRDTSFPDYGVELGGDISKRLQFRPVALSGESDDRNDLEMEYEWCDKFKILTRRLQRQGTELVVEKLIEPGLSPTKRIVDGLRASDAPRREEMGR
jgi:hypothetical protein